jgi:hypothetical protein
MLVGFLPTLPRSYTWRILVLSTSSRVEEEEERREALVVAGDAIRGAGVLNRDGNECVHVDGKCGGAPRVSDRALSCPAALLLLVCVYVLTSVREGRR